MISTIPIPGHWDKKDSNSSTNSCKLPGPPILKDRIKVFDAMVAKLDGQRNRVKQNESSESFDWDTCYQLQAKCRTTEPVVDRPTNSRAP